MFTENNILDYNAILEDGMRTIFKDVLCRISNYGSVPEGNQILVEFVTNFPGVALSDRVRTTYPDLIRLVLQYQFDNLEVHDDHFAVSMSFSGIYERVVVPYASITMFCDPNYKFGFNFDRKKVDQTAIAIRKKSFASGDSEYSKDGKVLTVKFNKS